MRYDHGMYKGNIVRDKSYSMALHTVALCRILNVSREYVLSKQLLKAGTSVAANIEEALDAQSKADFISKLSIALKEARETHFWLRLLRDSNIASPQQIRLLLSLVSEVVALLVSIIKKTKQNANLKV